MDILLAVISSFFLWNINGSLFMILVCMVVVNIVLVNVFKKPYKKLNYEQMEAGAMLNSQLIESIQNIETVKSMGDEKQQIDRLEVRFVRALEIGFKEGNLSNIQNVLSGMASSVGNLVFMGVGAIFIIDQKMSIGDLLVFQTLSTYFTEPVQNLVTLQLSFQEAQIAIKRLSEVMSLDREDKKENLIKEINLSGDIKFSKVTFAYGSRPPVIHDLSLNIKDGSRVAFVGESGAGKSTLARLLLKFVEPLDGKITLSNYDIQDIPNEYLRASIAYIPQNIELFTGSIIDNLKVGNPLATYEQIMIACRKAGADVFINKMPNRYEAFIEEGGSNLSGGEKQRIAIARVLLKDPSIYIFDEATSNLDSFSEQKIQELLFNRIQNKTMLIIAHRLSTIMRCDVICFMESGKIIEKGSHSELMRLNGKYAEMIRLQNSVGTEPVRENTNTEEGDMMIYE